MQKTKKAYEEHLNEVFSECCEAEAIFERFCYLKPLETLYLAKKNYHRVGTIIRKHDPILFETGFHDWRP